MSTFSSKETITTLEYLRLRRSPGYKGKHESDTKEVLAPGTVITVVGNPQSLDGLTWWPVRTSLDGGWVAETDAEGAPLLAGGEQADWERTIAFVLRWEGRFSDDRNDKGNWTGAAVGKGQFKGTKFGISAASYPTVDIINLSLEQARQIYFRDYWLASGANKLPWPLCLMHMDAAVNCGVYRAKVLLGEAAGDFLKYGEARKNFYRALDDFDRYGVAWLRRVDDVLAWGMQSRSMIAQGESMATKAELYQTIAGAFRQLGRIIPTTGATPHQTIAEAFEQLAELERDPVTPRPVEPTTPDDPANTRRLGQWVNRFGLSIKRIVDRPDAPLRAATTLYVVKDVFTVANGSWDVSGAFGGVDQWARDAYLKAMSDPLYIKAGGADHHLFGMVLDKDGKPVKDQVFQFWSDGFAKLGDPSYGYNWVRAQDASGWVNLPISKGSAYSVDRAESGPWCWCPNGASEVVVGGGMPNGQHVSTFVVWEALKIKD